MGLNTTTLSLPSGPRCLQVPRLAGAEAPGSARPLAAPHAGCGCPAGRPGSMPSACGDAAREARCAASGCLALPLPARAASRVCRRVAGAFLFLPVVAAVSGHGFGCRCVCGPCSCGDSLGVSLVAGLPGRCSRSPHWAVTLRPRMLACFLTHPAAVLCSRRALCWLASRGCPAIHLSLAAAIASIMLICLLAM